MLEISWTIVYTYISGQIFKNLLNENLANTTVLIINGRLLSRYVSSFSWFCDAFSHRMVTYSLVCIWLKAPCLN